MVRRHHGIELNDLVGVLCWIARVRPEAWTLAVAGTAGDMQKPAARAALEVADWLEGISSPTPPRSRRPVDQLPPSLPKP